MKKLLLTVSAVALVGLAGNVMAASTHRLHDQALTSGQSTTVTRTQRIPLNKAQKTHKNTRIAKRQRNKNLNKTTKRTRTNTY